jgi:hypothetical protein
MPLSEIFRPIHIVQGNRHVPFIADPITARFRACFWFIGMLVCLTGMDPLPAQGAQTSPEPQNGTLTINLYEAILLSLRNNRTVTSAYMDRVLSRFDFAREKAKFSPNFDIDITADITSQRVDTQYSESDSAGVKTESTKCGHERDHHPKGAHRGGVRVLMGCGFRQVMGFSHKRRSGRNKKMVGLIQPAAPQERRDRLQYRIDQTSRHGRAGKSAPS